MVRGQQGSRLFGLENAILHVDTASLICGRQLKEEKLRLAKKQTPLCNL